MIPAVVFYSSIVEPIPSEVEVSLPRMAYHQRAMSEDELLFIAPAFQDRVSQFFSSALAKQSF